MVACPDERRGSARAGALRSLEGFKMERVLDASAAGKSAAVLGSFEGKEGSAIIAVEKKSFDPQLLPGVCLNPKPYTQHPEP